jgi:hypothetical protein
MRLGSVDPFPVPIILKVVCNRVNGASGVRRRRLLPQRDIPAFRWQNGGTRITRGYFAGSEYEKRLKPIRRHISRLTIPNQRLLFSQSKGLV